MRLSFYCLICGCLLVIWYSSFLVADFCNLIRQSSSGCLVIWCSSLLVVVFLLFDISVLLYFCYLALQSSCNCLPVMWYPSFLESVFLLFYIATFLQISSFDAPVLWIGRLLPVMPWRRTCITDFKTMWEGVLFSELRSLVMPLLSGRVLEFSASLRQPSSFCVTF